jgi:hypothetical protein
MTGQLAADPETDPGGAAAEGTAGYSCCHDSPDELVGAAWASQI